MKYVKLTNLLGDTIVVNVEAIAILRPRIEGEPVGKTALQLTNGAHVWVKETIVEIEAKLHA